jgi:hypothetical protein
VKLNVLANWLPASIMNKIVVIPPLEDTAGVAVWKMVIVDFLSLKYIILMSF